MENTIRRKKGRKKDEYKYPLQKPKSERLAVCFNTLVETEQEDKLTGFADIVMIVVAAHDKAQQQASELLNTNSLPERHVSLFPLNRHRRKLPLHARDTTRQPLKFLMFHPGIL